MGERLTRAAAHQASWLNTDEPSLLQTSHQLLLFRAAPTDSQIHTFSGTQVSKVETRWLRAIAHLYQSTVGTRRLGIIFAAESNVSE